MRNCLVIILMLAGMLVGCESGINAPTGTIGLPGTPSGESSGGPVSFTEGGGTRISSSQYSGFISTCASLVAGRSEGGLFQMSDPLAEILGE